MKTAEEKARELTPLNEIAARKLKELREVDEYKGSNDSKDAITVMKEAMLEYANQQPEVDHVKDFHTWRLPHEKQPEQDKVREAAEKVVYEWHNSVGEECIDAAMIKLVKVLNQNKDE